MFSFVKIVSFLFLVNNLLVYVNLSSNDSWNYDFDDDSYGPLAWGQIAGYEDCSGSFQTPINIDYNTPLDGFDKFGSELEALNINTDGRTFLTQWDWNGEFIQHFEVSNNGHSLRFAPIDAEGNTLSGSNESIVRLTNMFANKSDSGSEFCLDSFHFHWGEHDTDGSEHTQYGVQYPAEIHFVHYSCDFANINEAVTEAVTGDSLEDTYVLAVVGFLFEVDDDASDEEISAWTELLQDIDVVEDEYDITNLMDVNLVGSFIPSDMQYVASGEYTKVSLSDSTMWYYEGSLTTPGCYEIVRWHVFDYKLKITSEVLEALRDLNGAHGKMTHNWRPIQKNDNPVYVFEFESGGTESTTGATASEKTTASTSGSGNTNGELPTNTVNSGDDDDDDEVSSSSGGSGNDNGGLIVALVILAILFLIAVGYVGYTKYGPGKKGTGEDAAVVMHTPQQKTKSPHKSPRKSPLASSPRGSEAKFVRVETGQSVTGATDDDL